MSCDVLTLPRVAWVRQGQRTPSAAYQLANPDWDLANHPDGGEIITTDRGLVWRGPR